MILLTTTVVRTSHNTTRTTTTVLYTVLGKILTNFGANGRHHLCTVIYQHSSSRVLLDKISEGFQVSTARQRERDPKKNQRISTIQLVVCANGARLCCVDVKHVKGTRAS